MYHKKLAQHVIDSIVQFNQDAGLLGKGYDDFLESSFQIEEALEGFYLDSILSILENSHPTCYEKVTAKDVSRAIVTHCIEPIDGRSMEALSDVDRLDKACDSVVYAIGSMAKLGLSAQEITQALNIVMDKNLEKLKNKSYDAEGKLLKNPSFIGPEAQLQLLLDKRK